MMHKVGAIHAWPTRRPLADLALIFVVYLALALLNITLGRAPGTVATLWLANAAAAGLIVTTGAAQRLPLLLAAAAANATANLAHGDPLALAVAFALPNVLEVAVAVALLERFGHVEHCLHEPSALLRTLLVGAVLPPIAGAALGAMLLETLNFAPFTKVWSDWYIGSLLGAFAMLPLVLALRAAPGAAALRRLLEPDTLLGLGTAAACAMAALVLMPYPFVGIGMVLLVVAFVCPRIATFAGLPVVVTLLAMALVWGWWVPDPSGSAVTHAHIFFAMLLSIGPPLVVAVAVARQRSLAELLNVVGDRADEVLVFVGLDGRCRWANATREAYFGESNDTVIGRHWRDVVGAKAYDEQIGPVFERARRGEVVRSVLEYHYPRTGPRIVSVVMQPAHDGEGHAVGVLASATDVTEIEAAHRQLELTTQRLESSLQRQEQFVRIASHDLREPLNTVSQFCRLIEDEPEFATLPAATRAYFAHLNAGAERMKVMLDDVLRFVRLDGAPEEPPSPVPLDEVLDGVLADLGALVARSGAAIQRQPLGFVVGHRALLALVLQNFVANAVKFVPPGRAPELRISAARRDGETWLSVADNGIGIEPARIAELGTPFRRLHARRRYDGTGLGLAICKRLAEVHGGRIHIESVPGAGSRFSLVLPVASTAGAAAPAQRPPVAGGAAAPATPARPATATAVVPASGVRSLPASPLAQ